MTAARTRRLALSREPLADLSPADLELVGAGAYDATPLCPTVGIVPCLTDDQRLCPRTIGKG